MRKDLIQTQPLHSSFLSVDKDVDMILKSLFKDAKPYSDILKRLLIINRPDCLDKESQNYEKYTELINSYSIGKLIEKGYIRLKPKIEMSQHQDIRSYILISLDNFSATRNSEFRDCTINFDVICYMDEWTLDNYQVRPLKICGYIDGILNSVTNKNKQLYKTNNNIKLSGIGSYNFLGCNLAVLNEDISMYTLSYRGVHFTEDMEILDA